MPPRPQVPDGLTRGPFGLGLAISLGLTPAQLRSSCWRRLFREVYCLAALPLTDQLRMQALRLAVPDHAVVTGLTAAWLFGVGQPPPGGSVPLHVATGTTDVPVAATGVRSSRLRIGPEDVAVHLGIRVTTPQRTCFGLMAASTVVEAVVWCDVFQHARLVTGDQLRAYADERPRWPHVRKVRLAVELSSPDAESPMESRLRMVIVAAGLPPPLVNLPIYDVLGNFRGRPDLHYVDPWLGVEYDGRHHHEDDQRERDDERENGLLVANVPLLRYGPRAVYKTPERIVGDILALRPDLGPLQPPAWAEKPGRPRRSAH